MRRHESYTRGFAKRQILPITLGLLMGALSTSASAITFDWDIGDGVKGVLNTRIDVGAQWRLEKRSADLVSKNINNPFMCPAAANGDGTSCQGQTVAVFPGHALLLQSAVGEGPGPNQAAVNQIGQFSNNADDGNINFDQWDMTQGIVKIGSDLTLTYGDFALFVRGYAFYDHVGYNLEQYQPNAVSPMVIAKRGHQRGYFGDPQYFERSDETRKQAGARFKLLDANISGRVPFIGDRELTITIGRQSINWGESTQLIVNSLNTFNPPNVNALYRPPTLKLSEVLEPVAAIDIATNITEFLSAEVFYQLKWEEAELPAPGSYWSFLDVGSHNARDYLDISFGKGPVNPEDVGMIDQMMLSAVTDSNATIPLLSENKARDSGQYGIALRYYATWLNNGTELDFYFANYHSRLPYLSFYAAQYGCLSGPSAPLPATGPLKGLTDVVNFTLACPGADPTLAVGAALGLPKRDQNIGPDGDAFSIDTIKARLEYPEDIKMYGFSFNTSFGNISVQGEVAYRPDAPLQVSAIDLGFAALQNAFPRGDRTGGPSDRYDFGVSLPVPGLGGTAVIAQLPGARYGVPDFVSRYRGRDPWSYQPGEYIRGWETFGTLQYNLGLTYIAGPGNWFTNLVGADQIIYLGEAGATQVLDMPSLSELQLEGSMASFTHASAGTDGTGADGSKQSNSGVIGPSGIRFNPTQELEGWATKFSWGLRLLALVRYPNIFPGITLENTWILGRDFTGYSPGPGGNFVEGRNQAISNWEFKFGNHWSVNVALGDYFGGGRYNLYRDRGFGNVGVSYIF